ncbi:MAG: alginate lyase family protein [Bacteroidetes bacterium]|nr:alginate lyase family protein [Bacteroidota bacterium]
MVIVFHSLRFLRPSMIYWRVFRTVKGVVIGMVEKAGLARMFFDRSLRPVPVTAVPPLSGRYHCEDIELAARRFSFLRDVETLPASPEALRAAVARKPLLWQFHFGYHDYLLALLAASDGALSGDVLAFVQEWDAAFPLHASGARRSAWHPYVLSIRIESWVRLHGMLTASGIDGDDPRLQVLGEGVEQMTRVLLRNLEKGTMANHLLRNIKGLVFAGLFLDTSTGAQARRIGMKLLDRELAEQVLDDGCHFERSPMYHVSMTNDVLDMAEAMLLSGASVPERLADATTRMTAFLERMRHPDGEIPFFNDSTGSFFLRTHEVLARGQALAPELREDPGAPLDEGLGSARSPVRRSQPTADGGGSAPQEEGLGSARPSAPREEAMNPAHISGLLVAESPRAWLVMDAGLVGPDYQPGHAHCDTLSFELSLDGRRFVTDTGVFHYRESPERVYSRCTAAHNTVEIDGAEQSEVWKSFRVGRRAKTSHVSREQRGDAVLLRGTHDGYERVQAGLQHERAMLLDGDGLVIADWLHGRGRHTWRSFLHFHPDMRIEETDGGFMAVLGDTEVMVRYHGGGSAHVFTSEYYPAFGEKHARRSLVFAGDGTLPVLLVVELSFVRKGRKVIVGSDGVEVEGFDRLRSGIAAS